MSKKDSSPRSTQPHRERQNAFAMQRHCLGLILSGAALVAGACATHEAPKPPQAPVAPVPAAKAQPIVPPQTPTVPRPQNASPQLGDGIQWFRSAAEYRAITISTYRAAGEAVTNAVKGKPRDSWAVVLDADETVLDNSVFQRDLARGSAPFSEELWATFVHQRSSVPVPGAKAFLDRVKDLGGRIAIVTNRFAILCDDTKENFKTQSLPFDVILCRVDTGDKNPRFASVANGSAFEDRKPREVVAFVGDNIQDFPALKQSLRDEPESAFDAFGKRFFVLPNPMYGSWQQVPAR
jgi:5'-nucleotidase (lipoprotein e(P4) family)